MLEGIMIGINYFLQLIEWLVLAYCVLGWFLPPYQGIMQFLGRLVDPLLRPIRNLLFRYIPKMMIDPSPIVFYFLLRIIKQLLWRLYSMVA